MALRADITQDLTNVDSALRCAYVIISQEGQDDGYFIFRFNSNGAMLFGDNYYPSLREAKFHCKSLYQIDEDAWYEYHDPVWSDIEAAKLE